MTSAGVIFEDVMNDVLLMGSLAASIFVKNPTSQNQAANLIKASALLLQVIEAQINGTAITVPTPTAPPPPAE